MAKPGHSWVCLRVGRRKGSLAPHEWQVGNMPHIAPVPVQPYSPLVKLSHLTKLSMQHTMTTPQPCSLQAMPSTSQCSNLCTKNACQRGSLHLCHCLKAHFLGWQPALLSAWSQLLSCTNACCHMLSYDTHEANKNSCSMQV